MFQKMHVSIQLWEFFGILIIIGQLLNLRKTYFEKLSIFNKEYIVLEKYS